MRVAERDCKEWYVFRERELRQKLITLFKLKKNIGLVVSRTWVH